MVEYSNRHAKRPRVSDTAAPNKATRIGQKQVKSRCNPQDTEDMKSLVASNKLPTSRHISTIKSSHDADQQNTSRTESWTLSEPLAGRYNNLDPIFTADENYLFLGLETSIHLYSISTARVVRSFQPAPGQTIVGCRISPGKGDYLYIFTSTGAVNKWDWQSGRQVSHWETNRKTLSIEVFFDQNEDDTQFQLLCLCERNDGKRAITAVDLRDGKSQEKLIFETSIRISHIRCAGQSRAIIAYHDNHLLLGTMDLDEASPTTSQYTWRELTLPVKITSMDIRSKVSSSQPKAGTSNRSRHWETLDLALGEANGSILVYHDVLNSLNKEGALEGGKGMAPRKLHWHREAVCATRWSKDGNYILSGGHESVMVLWQLDSGRKQFLPHLSSSICNIVVSPNGNSYIVKLADNSIVLLSARELQPFITITGLQIIPKVNKPRHQTVSARSPSIIPAVAVLDPQRPDQLLIAVPASHRATDHSSNSVLQTYDLRTSSHISRQALARTNATTLNVSPEGSYIAASDIKHLQLSHDGIWMATVDTWNPYPQDLESFGIVSPRTGSTSPLSEVFLKFWKRGSSSGMWELVTRVDTPHFSVEGAASVLDLAPRPRSHEFATIGSDAVLRLWFPGTRQRSGLKQNDNVGQPSEFWKCRNVIDLKNYLKSDGSDCLTAASLGFSQDGSVLAICLHSGHSTNPGLTVLIDVQNCVVRHSKTSVYSGTPCAVAFFESRLLVASSHSVSVWDTVNDRVKTIDLHGDTAIGGSQLLAANFNTGTFAVAPQTLPASSTSKKAHKAQYYAKIFDAYSLRLIAQMALPNCPLALLSAQHSSDYVIIDSASHVSRLACNGTTIQATGTRDLDIHLNSGLANLFGQGRDRTSRSVATTSTDHALSNTQGLATVFGDVPSFVQPPANILFQDVVQALAS
ncbi:WD domain protein [Aspergillus campestris IBT 28561]|uniref:WD domain protein n=1 Tax=Aspergillus campestris (strain IBT 28561) TaxID=1392248 RepID=A0A2I1CSS4_ASPC2|nr:WD domain protein [Aspergillus campestris IBT 28561]PKY00668.1 WD domain protein [Aspergillus campestris IBT 28561]